MQSGQRIKTFFLLKTLCIFFSLSATQNLFVQSPLLLEKYRDQQIDGWLMSEKLDGIRALWNGKELTTRKGNKIHAPAWFLKGFPPFAIDGELWSKRGEFEKIQSIVMRKQPHTGWKKLTYNIFDVPEQTGGLQERLHVLKNWMKENKAPYLRIIPQILCGGTGHLRRYQKNIETLGGEGIVLRDPKAPYIHGRTSSALKVKSFEDAECTVINHIPGNGKFKGMLGSLDCRLNNGITVRLGNGFTLFQRKNPPRIGSIITFKHQGWTARGLPRFPVFLHIRFPETM